MPEFRFRKFAGFVWRQTARGMHALNTGGSFMYGGRFNPSGAFQMLYTSLSIKGVQAEFLKFAQARSVNPFDLLPRELHQLYAELDPDWDVAAQGFQRSP